MVTIDKYVPKLLKNTKNFNDNRFHPPLSLPTAIYGCLQVLFSVVVYYIGQPSIYQKQYNKGSLIRENNDWAIWPLYIKVPNYLDLSKVNEPNLSSAASHPNYQYIIRRLLLANKDHISYALEWTHK
jgi:hypothetical protein